MSKSDEFTTYINSLYIKRAEWLTVATKYGAKYPEDVLQDSFIKLIEWRQRNEESKYNEGLFFFIVRNTSLDEARKITLTTEITETEILEEAHPQNDHEINAIHAEVAAFHWFDAKLLDVYFDLSRTQSQALTMRELAAETGISLSTIHTTIKRCKQRIKEAVHAARG